MSGNNINLTSLKILSDEDKQQLEQQNNRIVKEHVANDIEKNNKKYWDLFYKRNETRFFKDRNWTVNEFHELLKEENENTILFEVGCGVGNFIYPILSWSNITYFYACDISPRAIEFVKNNYNYDETKMKAFVCDITEDGVFDHVDENSIDIITLIFVLSAIHPDKFITVLKNLFKVLKPGGIILLRDYGLYDMTQLRFKPGHKIAENLYMRQDKTRSYFFSVEFVNDLFINCGFSVVDCNYVSRKTINIKEDIDVDRTFIQAKMEKSKS